MKWCERRGSQIPLITGIELDAKLAAFAEAKFADYPEVHIENTDFLTSNTRKYDFIISNPPYVSITQLSTQEKNKYKPLFKTAIGRFDLYLLFFEKALNILSDNRIMVYVTPEKYIYVETARPLREMLGRILVKELEFLREDSFSGLTTYPMVTTIERTSHKSPTNVMLRNSDTCVVELPITGDSWQPYLNGASNEPSKYTLEDICVRISCGVATGADKVYVIRNEEVMPELQEFAYPTISGRDLIYDKEIQVTNYSMLVPYDRNGNLLPFEELGAFGKYLKDPRRFKKLTARTCIKRKPWYAFHETPPMKLIDQPKILCKDITAKPNFWLDKEGRYITRHTIYYIIPKNLDILGLLLNFLRSDEAGEWLTKNSQRASKGFIRLQSSILKKLPIPEELYESSIIKITE